jgi:hypothetical protein
MNIEEGMTPTGVEKADLQFVIETRMAMELFNL